MNKSQLIEFASRMDDVMQEIGRLIDELEENMGEDEDLNECYESLEDAAVSLDEAESIITEMIEEM